MSQKYQEFNAKEYVKTDADVRELLQAAADEDLGNGAVIRAVLKHIARTQNMSGRALGTTPNHWLNL